MSASDGRASSNEGRRVSGLCCRACPASGTGGHVDRAAPMHYVCTHEEALALAASRSHYWLSDCGCRTEAGGCRRSRADVCLYFEADFSPTGGNWRKIGEDELGELFLEATRTRLVTRPFRSETDASRVAGICFCCDCCCAYFRDPTASCERGGMTESTDLSRCAACGACVEACYFGARSLKDFGLEIDRQQCHGCGLCVDACTERCIRMIERSRT